MSEEKKIRPCPFRPHAGIDCDEAGRKCLKCGWNYDVEKERIEKLYAKAAEKKACRSKT